MLENLGCDVREIKKSEDFDAEPCLDGIVLPGGESTTMAIVGERWGLFPRLKEW